jgi:small-conductance mechanosensitive channel
MSPLLLQELPVSFDMVRKLLDQLVAVAPNLFGALFLLLIGWLLARFIARIMRRLLRTVGVDKLGDQLNDIELVRKANIRIIISSILSKVIYYLLMLIFIVAATDTLGMEAVSQLMNDIINYIPNLLVAVIMLGVGLLFADFIKGVVQTTCRSLGIPSANLIANFVFYFLLIAVAMSALGQAQINTAFLQNNLTVIIGGGVLAFAFGYGLASRDMMANFIASFYSRSKVAIGDQVKIGEVEGQVIDVDNTTVTLQAEDRQVIVPLSKLTTENIELLNPRS